MPSPEVQLKEQIEESIKLTRQMLSNQEGLETKIKALEEKGGAADLKEQVNRMASDNAKAIDEINRLTKEIHERQDEFETKAAGRTAGAGAADPFGGCMKSFADARLPEQAAAKGDDLRMALRSGVRGAFDAKAVFSKAVTALAASGGDAIIPAYEPTIVVPGQQGITLLDVLPRVMTDSPIIYWVVELLGSRTDNAGIQSLDFTGTGQGTALGESDFVFDQKSAQTRTYGHTAKVALQMLEDVAQLRGYLENQMRYMVRFDLEGQVLNGSGVGTNMAGLKTTATAYDTTIDAAVPNLQRLDVLRMALLQCALTYFPATASVLNPTDVALLELAKDGQQGYIWVNPNSGNAARPWGVPLVSTTQQPADDFTVGAFNQVELAVRKEVEVLVATENEDDFDKNLATIKATGRGGLKNYQPTAVIDGDFSVALTGA